MLNKVNLEAMRPVPYWWDKVFPLLQLFSQRILIVADGALNFNPDSGAGLSRFVEELAKITPMPVITKAHRGTDPTADPGKENFIFDTSVKVFDPSSDRGYDQIWLFGFAVGPVLKGPEIKVLADFMAAGGGLFATGDHERLGFAMGGELPRVRKMRDWENCPMEIERIDTVTNPGPDRFTQFDDQSDEFPQRIFPHYYGSGESWSPHPLLRSPRGDIDVMPDHPHESVCGVGTNLEQPYNLHGLNFAEFPKVNGSPLAPQIIATAVSAGRFLNPPGTIVGKPPTTPCCFGAISVWDGDEVGEGRIVCAATWHHFVNVNLDGTEAVAAAGNNRCGLRDDCMNFTEDFHQIAEYYRNIADWLIPKARRPARWWIDIIIERYRFPLVEEWTPLPSSSLWKPRVKLGTLVENALNTHRGRGFTEELTTAFLEAAGLKVFADFIRPVKPEEAARDKFLGLLVSPDELRHAAIGSIFDVFVRDLPVNPSELPGALRTKECDNESLFQEATEAVALAVDAARDNFAKSMKKTRVFLQK